MAPAPIVTLGMAVYNGEATIAESMRSVLQESFPALELLLVDDGSTDGSLDVIQTFADPRIRLLRNDGNKGLVATRNRIVHEARGRYIAWLDQDDLSEPNRLATQVAFLDSHPEVVICGGQTAMLVEQGPGQFARRVERFPTSTQQVRASLLFLNPLACNTVMMRRAPFADSPPFRPEFGNSLDYDLWSRASDTMPVLNLPVVLGSYRVHAGQTSQGAALERMNRHALQVQTELAERALGMAWTDEQQAIHAQATIAPVVIENAAQVTAVAAWFRQLRTANASAAQRGLPGFDGPAFDEAIARQWTTVCLAAQRALGSTSAGRLAITGARQMGLPPARVLASMRAGFARRMSRR